VQGAKPVKATEKGKGRGKRSTKRQNDTTTDPAPLGHLPVTESAVGGTEVEGENEGSHSAPNPDPPEVVEQEQEISVDISDLLGSTILGFQPLNPGNSTERRPDHYLPIYTSTPARGHSIVTGKDVLWISGLRPEFPMINNSMEGTGQRNSGAGSVRLRADQGRYRQIFSLEQPSKQGIQNPHSSSLQKPRNYIQSHRGSKGCGSLGKPSRQNQ
jgi:hypothetical protein